MTNAFSVVQCSLVVTCWERANLLALLGVMIYYVFVTFPCGVLGQMWYLIVPISDLCLRTYSEFVKTNLRGKGWFLCVFLQQQMILKESILFRCWKKNSRCLWIRFQYFYSDKSGRVLYYKTSWRRTTTTGCSKQRSSPVWHWETTLWYWRFL